MKKQYLISISIIITIIIILGILYYNDILTFFNITSELNKLKVNLIIINLLVYIVRTLLIKLINILLKYKMLRFLITFFLNIIWIGFLFWLIFILSPELGIAIISFLIISISLTFKDRISNITSSIMILISKSIDIGDLIETNNYQGIVSEITLNYTKLSNFSGIDILIPNINIYNTSLKKFTQNISRLPGYKEDIMLSYTKIFQNVITFKEDKFTRYIKTIEIPYSFIDKEINEQLTKPFDKYEQLLGIRPFAYANRTNFDRLSITLQLLTKDPNMIIIYKNQFMKDILYELTPEKILLGLNSKNSEVE